MKTPTPFSTRDALCLALLAVLPGAVPPSAVAAAMAVQPPPPHSEPVNGRNLSRADFAQGRFVQEDRGWTEYGADGGPRFRFEETGRDEWSVYLLDRSRNFQIQLDVHRRMITFSANGGPRGDLYPITDMSSERPVSFAIGPDPRQARDAGGKPDGGRDDRDEAGGDGRDEAGGDDRDQAGGYGRDEADGDSDAAVGGFFRERGSPAVVYQVGETRHCTVQNPSQMRAFGGFEQVQMVSRLAMRGENSGPCAWPNGFYRRANEPTVYRLHGRGVLNLGRRACHVVDPRQMELFGGFGQLRVVEPSSSLFQDREQPGECEDPRGAR